MAGVKENRENCIQTLNILAMKKKMTPEYTLIEESTGTNHCLFTYQLTCGEFRLLGTGSSKKNAKHVAAQAMLDKLAEMEENNDGQKDGEMEWMRGHAISLLQSVCRRTNLEPPIYVELEESGPPHLRFFTFECLVSNLTTKGTDKKKKLAKNEAAMKMLMLLSENNPEIKAFLEERKEFSKSDDLASSNGGDNTINGNSQNHSENHSQMEVENQSASSDNLRNYWENPPGNSTANSSPTKSDPSLRTRKVAQLKIKEFFAALEQMDQLGCEQTDEKFDVEKEFSFILKLLNIKFEQFVQKTTDERFITTVYLMTDIPTVQSAVDYDAEYSKASAYYYVINTLGPLLDF